MPKKPEDIARSSASTSMVRQLNEVLSLLAQANAIIDKVQAHWSVPDAPERPPVVQALTAVKAQGSHVSNVAHRLLATVNR